MSTTKYKAIRRMLESLACLVLTPLLAAQQVAPSVATPAKTGEPIVLKKGMDVHLVLLESVSSATATKGQSVRMAVLEDVTDDNGTILIPKGTPATDVVDGVIKAVPGKRDGCLSLRPVSVNPPNSPPIALQDYPYQDGDALGTAMLPILPILWIATLIALPFHKATPEAGIDVRFEACGEELS